MSDSHDHVGFTAPDPAELSKLFPGYEIEGLIATGGMGAVYCAIQKSLDRTVALKILPQEFSKDAEFCAGFEAEAKAMARLNHPNLIGVYDFGEVGGMLFIIMEYVPGKSIYHSAHEQAIDPSEVIRLVTGVCEGLAHAHKNGIIHRDIKPSNILLELNAQPKIGDFGLARPIERKIEEGEQIFGTPGYTAPEVVNTPNSVDYRADIFSVGVLLHELLTGKLPSEDRRPPSLISKCDPRFDAIVRRATNENPAGRYSSATEMAKELAAIATSSVSRVKRRRVAGAPGHPGLRVAGPLQLRRVLEAKKSSNPSFFVVCLVIAAVGVGVYIYLNKLPQPGGVVAPKTIHSPAVIPPKAPVEPEPQPQSETSPPPVPEANIETTTGRKPEVTPETPPPALPKYDVAGFFARARKIMQERAKPYLFEHHSNLKTNFADFERALKRQVSNVETGRSALEKLLDQRVAAWRGSTGFLIPKEIDKNLATIPKVAETFAVYRKIEGNFKDTFQKALAPLSAIYVQGMEMQVGRLKADNDLGAIKLIEAEIDRTKQSRGYFAKLMEGNPPGSAK